MLEDSSRGPLVVVWIILTSCFSACVLLWAWIKEARFKVWHDNSRWWEQPLSTNNPRMGAEPCQVCPVCSKPNPGHRCGRCKSVAYCGKDCQKVHWRSGHKESCRPPAKVTPPEEDEVAPVPSQVLFPYHKFVQLATQQSESTPPVGLVNNGNTCFANALLQCLLNTQPLAAYLRSGIHSGSCRKPKSSYWCLLCELQRLAEQVRDAQEEGLALVSPRNITRNIRQIATHFSVGRQEDSHDLYLAMLESLEGILLYQEGANKETVPDIRSRKTTFIGHCFTGYVCYQTECTSCSWVSQRFDTKVALEVEVSPRTPTLEASLNASFADETLDDDNRYKCDRCKQAVRATRHSCVEVAPNVLVLCLKRFGLGRFSKNNRHVAYRQTLDMEPFKGDGCTDQVPAGYHLSGVLVHVDVMNSTAYGHYVAYVRLQDGRWFLCDDSRVVQVNAQEALSQNAYMLFYQRDTPRAAPDPSRKRPPSTATTPAKAPPVARRRRASLPSVPQTNGHAPHPAQANGRANGYPSTSNGNGVEEYAASSNGNGSAHGGEGYGAAATAAQRGYTTTTGTTNGVRLEGHGDSEAQQQGYPAVANGDGDEGHAVATPARPAPLQVVASPVVANGHHHLANGYVNGGPSANGHGVGMRVGAGMEQVGMEQVGMEQVGVSFCSSPRGEGGASGSPLRKTSFLTGPPGGIGGGSGGDAYEGGSPSGGSPTRSPVTLGSSRSMGGGGFGSVGGRLGLAGSGGSSGGGSGSGGYHGRPVVLPTSPSAPLSSSMAGARGQGGHQQGGLMPPEAALSASPRSFHGFTSPTTGALAGCAHVHAWPSQPQRRLEFAGVTLPGNQATLPIPIWRFANRSSSSIGSRPSSSHPGTPAAPGGVGATPDHPEPAPSSNTSVTEPLTAAPTTSAPLPTRTTEAVPPSTSAEQPPSMAQEAEQAPTVPAASEASPTPPATTAPSAEQPATPTTSLPEAGPVPPPPGPIRTHPTAPADTSASVPSAPSLTLYVSLPGVPSVDAVRLAILGNQLLVWVPGNYLLPIHLPARPPSSPAFGGSRPLTPHASSVTPHASSVTPHASSATPATSTQVPASSQTAPDVPPQLGVMREQGGVAATTGPSTLTAAPTGPAAYTPASYVPLSHSFRARSCQLKVTLAVAPQAGFFEAGDFSNLLPDELDQQYNQQQYNQQYNQQQYNQQQGAERQGSGGLQGSPSLRRRQSAHSSLQDSLA